MNNETKTSTEKPPEIQDESETDVLTVEQLDEVAGAGNLPSEPGRR